MKAKKSLGQNFLKSRSTVEKIVTAAKISSGDIILEIGPGKGALTKKLLEHAERVIAVEKDAALFENLQLMFARDIQSGKLLLIDGDILEFDIDSVLGKQKYKIVANIPYNITGAIMKKFLTASHQPSDMVVMVQYEVARRMLGRNERGKAKESVLSISVKAYGSPEMVTKVPKRYFLPAPKVDSAVIAIKSISRKAFIGSEIGEKIVDEEKFWDIVHAGFAHKRKKLSSNLKNAPIREKSLLVGLANSRAEDLTLDGWLALTRG